ncbi:hypothetical protein FACS189494_08620 [Spirochaetia bacterium]|nr:hypothetical protein FACS189494_08620 [Spirochaetia bacterium]
MAVIKMSELGFVSSMIRIIFTPALSKAAFKTLGSILYNFFFIQHRASLNRKRIKITNVDHELDFLIPFTPSWINIYMDFSPLWIRAQAFLIKAFGKIAYPEINNFIDGIGNIYARAASVYKENFSTTTRPNCKINIGFRTIHTFDPHLMCIPSLHVMVVVFTYIKMCSILRRLNAESEYKEQLKGLRLQAIAITESILFIKQHSVNCIAASLYALTYLEESGFTVQEMEDFVQSMFAKESTIHCDIIKQIKAYILSLYHSFLEEEKKTLDWRQPLLDFLRGYKPYLPQGGQGC